MEREPAIRLIDKTFNNNFTEENYYNFIINLLDGVNTKPEEGAFKTPLIGQYVPESFRDHIKGYHRIGKYYDSNNKVIEVLWVNLKKETALDRARTMQRNFIAWYLNGGRGGHKRDCALVAFYNEDLPDWRFSYVKMDYSLIQKESGNFGAIKEFTPAKRFSFLVGEYEPNHTAQKRLLTILEKDKPNLEDIEEAFNIEKVSKEFFAKYKELYLSLVDSLTEIRKNDNFIEFEFTTKQVSEANFCKKLLGQIVFLYFLQKKGWLGVEKRSQWGSGDKRFLRNLFKSAINEGKNFFNDYMEHLFYEALAVERDEDYYSPFNCKIPFLDGGLFEPINEYSWATTDIVLPNELFSNDKKTPEGDIGTGILDVFDRYNFTVKEDEPLEKEVAVDPEMLGKVFEELLEVQDRKSKGAFYTPREIVHYMCQESLINYLATELEGKVDKEDIANLIRYGDVAIQNEATARAKEKKIKAGEQKTTTISYKLAPSIKEYAKEIDKALADIKICDPAIGSGAFPVGIMNEIIRARLTLLESDYLRTFKDTLEKEDFIAKMRYEYKREAIQNSIYGVDIDCGAIEIAKLRLWMSLIVDEDDITKIKPLPNLDYKIVCGNSLIGIEKNLFNAMHLKKLEELKPQYFGETRKREKKKLKKEIDSILEELTKGGGFDFEIHFSEVFHEKGGFDIIIANPPYIKEFTNKDAFNGLRKSEYYQGKMDLWYFFGCISLDILNSKGIQCFIATNNWITNAGASILRNKILKEAKILNYIDFGNYKVFESADIQTMVYFLTKDNQDNVYDLSYAKLLKDKITAEELEIFLNNPFPNGFYTKYIAEIDRKQILSCNSISFLPLKVSKIINLIDSKDCIKFIDKEVGTGIDVHQDFLNKKNAEILGNSFKIGDGIFILSDKEKSSLNLTNKELKDCIRPYFTTDELERYYGYKQNKYWIIYTKSNTNKIINEYPNIKKHLDKFSSIITSDFKPYGLHRARDEQFFQGEKIISLRKCSQPTFTYTNFDCYVSQTFFVIKTSRINLKYLSVILNSKIIEFWLLLKGKLQGNNYQIDKEPLMNIPIKMCKNQSHLINLADYILFLKSLSESKDSIQYKINYFDNLINGIVYELYFKEALEKEDCLVIDDITQRVKPIDYDTYSKNNNCEIGAKNLAIIEEVFKKLDYPNSPINQKLFKQKLVEPVKTIEEHLRK